MRRTIPSIFNLMIANTFNLEKVRLFLKALQRDKILYLKQTNRSFPVTLLPMTINQLQEMQNSLILVLQLVSFNENVPTRSSEWDVFNGFFVK